MINKIIKKAFTLVELVIVIAIIAILAGVSIGTYFIVIDKSNNSRCEQEIRYIYNQIKVSSINKLTLNDDGDYVQYKQNIGLEMTQNDEDFVYHTLKDNYSEINDLNIVSLDAFGSEKEYISSANYNLFMYVIYDNEIFILKYIGFLSKNLDSKYIKFINLENGELVNDFSGNFIKNNNELKSTLNFSSYDYSSDFVSSYSDGNNINYTKIKTIGYSSKIVNDSVLTNTTNVGKISKLNIKFKNNISNKIKIFGVNERQDIEDLYYFDINDDKFDFIEKNDYLDPKENFKQYIEKHKTYDLVFSNNESNSINEISLNFSYIKRFYYLIVLSSDGTFDEISEINFYYKNTSIIKDNYNFEIVSSGMYESYIIGIVDPVYFIKNNNGYYISGFQTYYFILFYFKHGVKIENVSIKQDENPLYNVTTQNTNNIVYFNIKQNEESSNSSRTNLSINLNNGKTIEINNITFSSGM